MASLHKASIASTPNSLHTQRPPPNMWAWTRRLNQLFQSYDYDIDKWLQSNLTNSFWLLRLSLIFVALVCYLILQPFNIPTKGSGNSGFVAASMPFAKHLSSVSLLFVLTVFTLSTFIRSIKPLKYEFIMTNCNANLFWLGIMNLHWLYFSALIYSVNALTFSLLGISWSRIKYQDVIYIALPLVNTLIMVVDCLCTQLHRPFVTDLLPLLLVFVAVPYSVICTVLLLTNDNLTLLGMVIYWATIMLSTSICFAFSLAITVYKERSLVQQ